MHVEAGAVQHVEAAIINSLQPASVLEPAGFWSGTCGNQATEFPAAGTHERAHREGQGAAGEVHLKGALTAVAVHGEVRWSIQVHRHLHGSRHGTVEHAQQMHSGTNHQLICANGVHVAP